jgi:two-component system sensor histidine kinase UhpB
MPNRYHLLHVEDSPEDAELLRHALENAPTAFSITRVENESDYAAQLESRPPDVILCDYAMPNFSAERALEITRARNLDLPFIIVSHHLDETAAVVAMQNGASDYLPKRNLGRLPKAIEAAVDRTKARRERIKAQEALRDSEAIRRGMLDSLPSCIALIDGDGKIVMANKSWENFDDGRGASGEAGLARGDNFFEAMARAHECGYAFAAAMALGVRAVAARATPMFTMEYEIPRRSGSTWHVARAMPLEGDGAATVVSHRDVTDRAAGRAALQDANARLQTISKRMLALQEDERRAISRELHDDIGQTLGALKIGLHRISSASPAEAPALVLGCIQAAEQALEKLRLLAMDLRPPQLDQLGLGDALEWLAQRQSAASGLQVTCGLGGFDTRPPPAVESACYRIVQEALNNAARHANASVVTIEVESDGATTRLVVNDDGTGFDVDAARLRVLRTGSMGLIGMEERAQLAGGRLTVRSAPGEGATISATFPS